MPHNAFPPGPKPRFLIGNMPLAGADPLARFEAWAREYGDIFHYRAAWLPVYFLNHPDYIERVLVTQQQDFLKDRVIQNSRWFLGQGLLTNEGSSWLRQRRLSQPAFHRDRLAMYAKTIAEYSHEGVSSWRDGEVRDLHQDMMELTLRIVAKLLFGVEVGEQTQRVSHALNLLMKHSSGIRMILPPIVRYLPLPTLIRMRRAISRLDETVYTIIRQRRASGEDTGDLLSMLIAARDEDGTQMSDRQLRDEVMTFLLAGYETTALALSWMWYLLSQNRSAEAELHQELAAVLKGRAATFGDLPQLRFTEAVVKETMRLYPPAWSVAREAAREVEIAGYRIPAGSNIVMSQWIMHRDQRYFPDPHKFDPARWLNGATQRLPRYAYFPFGGGPRLCIGASFAMMEAALVLATIAPKFSFRLLPGHLVKPVPSITLRPQHGIKMSVHELPATAGEPQHELTDSAVPYKMA